MSRRANGEGSKPRLISGSRWRSVIAFGLRPDGKPNRKYVYGKSEKECLANLRKVVRSIEDTGTLPPSDKRTVAQFMSYWLENHASVKSAATYHWYKMACELHILPFTKHLLLSKFRVPECQVFFNGLVKAGRSPSTISQVKRTLSAALERGIRWEMVSINPVPLVTVPKYKSRERVPLDEAQVGAVLEAARKAGYYALFVLALETGCREGELLALTWESIDFKAGVLRVLYGLCEVAGVMSVQPPKNNSTRTIRLSLDSLAALRAHQKVQEASERPNPLGLVFPTKTGKYVCKSSFRKAWNRVYTTAKVPLGENGYTFHDLRHTSATMDLERGASLHSVSKRLGHRQVSTTLGIYGHATEESKNKVADLLEYVNRKKASNE